MTTYFNFAFEREDDCSVETRRPIENIVANVYTSEALQRMSKRQLLKNLLVVSTGFLFLFCAFQALGNLQSTLNSKDGLGVASQAVIYGTLIISSMFLPTITIKKLGCKRSLILCILGYCPYLLANFHPRWETMIPGAFIVGLVGAPLWSAKCTYLNEIGSRYAELTHEKDDAVMVRFFGIFFMFFQSSQIWGNLISYFILKPDNKTMSVNGSSDMCGIKFCPHNLNNDNPPSHRVHILLGVYIGAALLAAVVVAVFLDPLNRVCTQKEDLSVLIAATFRHMRQSQQLLLIPITMYSGIEQAFFLSEYTKAFIACPLGIHFIGFVSVFFGLVNAVFSVSSGLIIKYIKRMSLFFLAAVCNLFTCVAFFRWQPNPNDFLGFFLCAGIWGLADAVWQTQINAFYGVLFKSNREAAFANYRLWESIGFMMAFGYSNTLCMISKTVILLSFLILGIVGYLITEIQLHNRQWPRN